MEPFGKVGGASEDMALAVVNPPGGRCQCRVEASVAAECVVV
jgi:hypothetical protein